MAYTAPKTWGTGDTILSSDFNTYIRDNAIALKDPPSADYICDETAEYLITSLTFIDVDSTNLTLTLITTGGDVMVHFHGQASVSAVSVYGYLDVAVDNVDVGLDDGVTALRSPSSDYAIHFPVSFTRLITGLAAGTHTFALRAKVSGGGMRFWNGDGGANVDTHPQFWAREVS